MSIRPELREELLKLSAKERLELAEELYSSVPEELADPECDAAWVAEIRKRIEAIRTGQVEGIPAEEAFANVRSRLAARRG